MPCIVTIFKGNISLSYALYKHILTIMNNLCRLGIMAKSGRPREFGGRANYLVLLSVSARLRRSADFSFFPLEHNIAALPTMEEPNRSLDALILTPTDKNHTTKHIAPLLLFEHVVF